MRFVRSKTSIPIPQVLAAFEYDKEVFIYYGARRRRRAPQELRRLRIPPSAHIGDFPQGGGDLWAVLRRASPPSVFKQPPALATADDFVCFLIAELTPRTNRPRYGNVLPHINSLDKSAPIVLTHGDLHSRNILVRDGRLAAIIDWEMARWYPEWLEAEIAGSHRDEWDLRAGVVAATLGAKEVERRDSPYLWVSALHNFLAKDARGKLEWDKE
ncbi:hypothetical protein JCM10296v2_005465 [Rhodotorula toruloides]